VLVLGAVLGTLLGVAGGSAALGLSGFILAVALWFLSTQAVNKRWAGTLEAVTRSVESEGQKWLHLSDGEFRPHVFVTPSGSSAFVTSAKQYRFTCTYVTPALVAVYEGTAYDAIGRRLTPGTTTKEVYFRQIVGVEYRPPQIQIKSTDGEPFILQAPSDEAAHAIIGQIRGQLREMHA
jgi:hypothetical protein